MSNDEANRAERRRQAREAAHQTITQQPKASATAIDEKFAPVVPAVAVEPVTPVVEKPIPAAAAGASVKPKSKREIKKARDEAVKRQVEAESLRMPEPAPDVKYKPGDTIPLHILNQRARQAEQEARDEAVAIGQAVGKFAEQQVTTRVPRSVQRSKRMRDAQLLMDKAKASKA